MRRIGKQCPGSALRVIGALGLLLLTTGPLRAAALPGAPADEEVAPAAPTLMHSPPSDAAAGKPVYLSALLHGPWDTADIRVLYRRLSDDGRPGAWQELALRRSTEGNVQTRVPAEALGHPGFEYTIAAYGPGDRVSYHFATPDAPHRVLVLRDSSEQRYQRRLGHHGGRVHSASAEGVGVWFGKRRETVPGKTPASFDDYLWNAEASYTYRFLGPVYSMTFGAGSLRGIGEEWGFRKLEGTSPSKPGIDYGFSAIRFAIVDWILLSAEVRLGADERGFVGGVGGTATVGRPAGTHLDLGADWTYGVGYRAFLEFAWDTVPYCIMSLRGEITNWPDEAHAGTIATFNTAIRVHPLAALKLSLGFAGRHGESSAGLVGGVGTEFYF